VVIYHFLSTRISAAVQKPHNTSHYSRNVVTNKC